MSNMSVEANPSGCRESSWLPRSLLDRLQLTNRRPVQHRARWIEPRPVTRTIPALLPGIPVHDAPEVSAHRRALVDLAVVIAICRDLVLAAADHPPFTPRDVL